MAVIIDTSANGKYGMFSATNTTLATVLSEVLDELETHSKSAEKTDFVLTSDGTNFSFVAIVKN